MNDEKETIAVIGKIDDVREFMSAHKSDDRFDAHIVDDWNWEDNKHWMQQHINQHHSFLLVSNTGELPFTSYHDEVTYLLNNTPYPDEIKCSAEYYCGWIWMQPTEFPGCSMRVFVPEADCPVHDVYKHNVEVTNKWTVKVPTMLLLATILLLLGMTIRYSQMRQVSVAQSALLDNTYQALLESEDNFDLAIDVIASYKDLISLRDLQLEEAYNLMETVVTNKQELIDAYEHNANVMLEELAICQSHKDISEYHLDICRDALSEEYNK